MFNPFSVPQAAIKERYSFNPSHLRAYFHYQPSYYHLHIHFANVSYESTSCALGKSHLLDDVIDRLKEDSDYYAKVALTFVTKDNDPLVAKFRAAGRLEEWKVRMLLDLYWTAKYDLL